MQPTPDPYPVSFAFDAPETVSRWRPLVHWLLAIPHFVVLYVLQIVAGVCAFIAWFAILFTGRMPAGLAGLISMYLRYSARVSTYAVFMREDYPPFSFDTGPADPGDDPPVRVEVTPELDDRSRLTVFFRYFMVLPHVVVLGLIGIAVAFVLIISFFAVIILGRWPEGLRGFMLGYMRWWIRVTGYQYLLTDRYPPFSTA